MNVLLFILLGPQRKTKKQTFKPVNSFSQFWEIVLRDFFDGFSFFFFFLCFLFPLPNRCWIIPLICFLWWSTIHCYNKVLKSISLQTEEIYFPSILVVPAHEVGLVALRPVMRQSLQREHGTEHAMVYSCYVHVTKKWRKGEPTVPPWRPPIGLMAWRLSISYICWSRKQMAVSLYCLVCFFFLCPLRFFSKFVNVLLNNNKKLRIICWVCSVFLCSFFYDNLSYFFNRLFIY